MNGNPGRTFSDVHVRVKELTRTFEANKHAYLSPDYGEAQAPKDFIDKFFIALGWNVNHNILIVCTLFNYQNLFWTDVIFTLAGLYNGHRERKRPGHRRHANSAHPGTPLPRRHKR